VSALALPEDSTVRGFFDLVGASPMALLIGVLLAIACLGLARGWGLARVEDVLASALPATAAVILITGAGGTFGYVLSETGVADAVADMLTSTGLPILLLAWLMA
ncbi:TRAP transporter large permease subunit, partial [Rhizobium hidalgonense]